MRLLDLFAGAGGAACGYQRAGFHVTGVDIAPQPNYCGDEFVQADALGLVATFPWWEVDAEFDAIRAFRTKMYWKWYPRRPNAAGWVLTVWIVWRVLRAGGGT